MDSTLQLNTNESEADVQSVVFKIGDESYGIDIFRVNEIIRLREITPIPLSEPHILGLVNLRGKTIPVVDLRVRLCLAPEEPTQSNRIIVIETDKGHVGMMVDMVSEVVTFAPDEIQPAPKMVANDEAKFVTSIARRDDNLISMLDLDQALAA